MWKTYLQEIFKVLKKKILSKNLKKITALFFRMLLNILLKEYEY